MGGHVFDPLEAAVIELLSSAGGVEPHDLDQDRVAEVGDRRVIECQMAVLADARANNVGRVGQEQILVEKTRLQRALSLLTRYEAHPFSPQADEPEQMFLKIP